MRLINQLDDDEKYCLARALNPAIWEKRTGKTK
jgi:hypothetical protein